MTTSAYQTKPDDNEIGFPKGIKYIIGNEGCERFSYYGMNAILYVYCVSLFMEHSLMSADMAADKATATVHLFKTGVYALPMIGAIIADRLFGKYNTILWLSIVYCFGHLVLSLTEGSIVGLNAGLFLIALGAGGIKPCVSAHVGDQFGKKNFGLLERVYQIFYFTINFGSFFSVLLIPIIKETYGFTVAFAIPGILMAIATLFFYMGRKEFVHVPATPKGRIGALDAVSSSLLFMTFGSIFFTKEYSFAVIALVSALFLALGLTVFFYRQKVKRDDGFLAVSMFMLKEYFLVLFKGKKLMALSPVGSASLGNSGVISNEAKKEFGEEAVSGAKAILKIISVFFMVSIFWALFDQHSSSWIRQASMMDLDFLGIKLLPSQIPSLNPVMVMMLIPFWAYVIEPFLLKLNIKITPLRKMTWGMALASLSFVAVALLQRQIDSDGAGSVHVLWQVVPYLLITLSEVLVSITGLEFAYAEAPKKMKSTVMGFWLLTVALGNALVALLAQFSGLKLVNFFWLFAILMAVAAFIFGIRASTYNSKTE